MWILGSGWGCSWVAVSSWLLPTQSTPLCPSHVGGCTRVLLLTHISPSSSSPSCCLMHIILALSILQLFYTPRPALPCPQHPAAV